MWMVVRMNIRSQSLVSPSLKKLKLGDCGSLLNNIDCCSLESFIITSKSVTSIQLQTWSLPALQDLEFSCSELTSIGVSTSIPLSAGTNNIIEFSKLNTLTIENCFRLSIVDGLLQRFAGFSSLKHLSVFRCPHLNWRSGLVLPSSLQTLKLYDCGDLSACVPGCLENLKSLVALRLSLCQRLTSIPGNIWCSTLSSLEELVIRHCPDLVSIGGAEAVAKIKMVEISDCRKFKKAELTQIRRRG